MRALFAFLLCAGCAAHVRPPPPTVARVVITNEDSNELSVIDPKSLQVVRTIFVGKRPRGVRSGRDGKTVFVALSGSTRAPPGVDESALPPPDRDADGIAVVDLDQGKVVRVLESGDDPESFDLSKDGARLFVSNEDAATLSILDVASGKVLRALPTGGEPEGVRARPDGAEVWVTSEETGKVFVFDAATGNERARVPVGHRPRSVAFTPDGARAFVANELDGSVSVIDARSHQPLSTIALAKGARPMGTEVSADGKRLYVSTGRGRTVVELDTETLAVLRTFADVGVRPWGLAIGPGGRLFVANGPSNDVAVIDLGAGKIVARLPTGSLPWGVAVAP